MVKNLGFWLDTQTYMQSVTGNTYKFNGKEVMLKVDPTDAPLLDKPVVFAEEIVKRWVGSTATRSEINLSDDMRQSLIQAVKSGGENPVDFSPSQAEARHMMVSEARFARFVHKQMTQNLTNSKGRFRLGLGLVLFAIFIPLGLLLRLIVPGMPRYGIAILLFPPMAAGFYYAVSGKLRS